MSAELEETSLRDEVPQDDIGVPGATGEAHTNIIESQLGDGGFVTVEGNYDRAGSRVPDTDTAIVVARVEKEKNKLAQEDAGSSDKWESDLPNGEDIFIGFALCNHRHLRSAGGIAPAAEQFSLLNIPAENLLTGTDNGSTGASLANCAASLLILGPDRIRGRRGDEPECIRVLEFARIKKRVSRPHSVPAVSDQLTSKISPSWVDGKIFGESCYR